MNYIKEFALIDLLFAISADDVTSVKGLFTKIKDLSVVKVDLNYKQKKNYFCIVVLLNF